MLYKATNILKDGKPYSAKFNQFTYVKIVANNKSLSKVLTKYKKRYYLANNSPSTRQTTEYMLPMYSIYLETMIKEMEKVREQDKISQGFNKFEIESSYFGNIMVNWESYSLEGVPALIAL